MGRTCTGYRDQLALMFRDERQRIEERARRAKDGRNVAPKFAQSQGLSLPMEDTTVCQFYHAVSATLRHGSHAHYLHLQLPVLYSSSNFESALRLSTQAIAYAWATSIGRGSARLSKQRYAKALYAVNLAINDPLEVKSDSLLCAIFLLGGYETLSCASGSFSSWGAHVDGLAALLRIRDTQSQKDPFSHRLFLHARKAIVISHLQISRPTGNCLNGPSHPSSNEDMEDQLISRIANIPNLQCFTNNITNHLQTAENQKSLLEIIQTAMTLDFYVAGWAESIPATWAYVAAANIEDISAQDSSISQYTPKHIHRYPDLYTARIWNLYRVSRIILHSIILRAASCLSAMSSNHEIIKSNEIERTGNELVSEICASVAFLSGNDLSRIRLPSSDEKLKKDAASTKNDSQQGRFSLIWPLYVGCTFQSIPSNQRSWMRAQLHRIGELGEPHAKTLAATKSKTLSGGQETFRFECV